MGEIILPHIKKLKMIKGDDNLILKVNDGFTLPYFANMVNYYSEATKSIGLWQSEKDLILKYTNINSKILDVGCGTGRISNGLYQLGYQNVIGIDFSKYMLKEARNLNNDISYINNDVRDIIVKNSYFDLAIFSFNGLVLIPGWDNRIKAIQEVYRVLKPNGIFIFTTDDFRFMEIPKYQEYWELEKEKWKQGLQDERYIEFGDYIFSTDEGDVYFYFNTIEEMINVLNNNGFKVLEHFNRNSRYIENEKIMDFCLDCRFWICKKQ